MKFEFRLQSSKEKKRKLIKKPKIFKLFKSRDVDKEIVTGVPVSTDLFNRTLYTTPNGNFRALGDEYNLYSNVFQGQNNFVTLAPPKEEDEEDTRPPEKPNKDIGTIIITPPPPKPLWNLCYGVHHVDDWANDRIYMNTIPVLASNVMPTLIFNPRDERYQEEYPEFYNMGYYDVFGFINQTALIIAYFSSSPPKLVLVDYNGNIKGIRGEVEIYQTIGAEFTIYNGEFYFMLTRQNTETGKYELYINKLKDDLTIASVNKIETDNPNTILSPWKNFVAISERDLKKIRVYNFLTKELVCDIQSETVGNIYLSGGNNNIACFTMGWAQTLILRNQYCIILNSDGESQVITKPGIGMHADINNEQLVLYYFPYADYRYPESKTIFSYEYRTPMGYVNYNGKSYIGADRYLWYTQNGKYYYLERRFEFYTFPSYILDMQVINGTFVIATSTSNPSSGEYKNKHICEIISTTGDVNGEWNSTIISRNEGWIAKKMIVMDNGELLLYGSRRTYDYRGNGSLILYKSTNGRDWSLLLNANITSDNLFYLGDGKLISFGYPHYYSNNYGQSWVSLSDNDIFPEKENDNSISYHVGITKISQNLDDRNILLMSNRYIDEIRYYQSNGISFYTRGKITDDELILDNLDGKGQITGTQNAIIATVFNHPFYDDEGNIVSEKPHHFRSVNGGYNWQKIDETGLYHPYPMWKAFKINNVVIGPLTGTTDIWRYSDDNFQTFKEIEVDHTGIIEVYNKENNQYVFHKEYRFPSEIIYSQGLIGHANEYAKIYKNKFYFHDYVFDFITERLTPLQRSITNLFIDNFRFYSRYEETNNWKLTFFAQNLDTGEEILLDKDFYPEFYPIQYLTYYLR